MITALEVDRERPSMTVVVEATVPGTEVTIVIWTHPAFNRTKRYVVATYRRGSHLSSCGRATLNEAREAANDSWAWQVQLRDRAPF